MVSGMNCSFQSAIEHEGRFCERSQRDPDNLNVVCVHNTDYSKVNFAANTENRAGCGTCRPTHLMG